MAIENIIVTRHSALVEYLSGLGITGKVIPHATEEDVAGKHVYGVLPYRLACLTSANAEVSLTLRPDQRGTELTLADIESASPALTTCKVMRVAE